MNIYFLVKNIEKQIMISDILTLYEYFTYDKVFLKKDDELIITSSLAERENYTEYNKIFKLDLDIDDYRNCLRILKNGMCLISIMILKNCGIIKEIKYDE